MRRREEALINDDYILTLNKRAEPERDSAHVSSAKILIGGPRSWAMVFSLLQVQEIQSRPRTTHAHYLAIFSTLLIFG